MSDMQIYILDKLEEYYDLKAFESMEDWTGAYHFVRWITGLSDVTILDKIIGDVRDEKGENNE